MATLSQRKLRYSVKVVSHDQNVNNTRPTSPSNPSNGIKRKTNRSNANLQASSIESLLDLK